MKTKTFRGRMQLKTGGQEGEVQAVFATLNVIDHDGDVTLPGAFGEQRVFIEPWNHNYQAPPVGKGMIREIENEAVVDGQFFMDTTAGREHHAVVKAAGDMQEWSYTFRVVAAEPGMFDGQPVQFLKRLDVIGVSPVTRGAGIATRTTVIKGAEAAKPYPNEHACRLRDPGDFQDGSFRRITREHEGKTYSVIVGRLEGETALTEQAYRYDKEVWSESQARAHCRSHDGSFEAAEKQIENASDGDSDTGDGDEGETHSGKPSGPLPVVIATQIDIDLLEV